MALVFIKTVIFGSDHRPKSTQLFLAIATDHINIKLILGRLQIMKSTETIYFWRCLLVNGFSGAITFTRITMRFSIQLRIWPQVSQSNNLVR